MTNTSFPHIEIQQHSNDADLSNWGRPMNHFGLFGRHPETLAKFGVHRKNYSQAEFDIQAATTLNYSGPENSPYRHGQAKIQHSLFEIDNAVMMFPNGMMVLPETDGLIMESCWQTQIHSHPAFAGNRSTKGKWHSNMDFTAPPVVDAGPVIHCYHRFYHQYFHWFIDCLPRLWLMQKHGFDDLPIILGNIKPNSPQHRSLALFGIDLDRLYFPEGRYVRFSSALCAFSRLDETLHVRPSFQDGVHFKGGWDPLYLAWLNDAVRSSCRDVSVSTGRRLYVDRSAAAHRRLVQNTRFHAFLKENGFDFIDPGAYSFEEQVAMFNKAELVVGPHGAGLSNILWCDPNRDVSVVEIGIQSVYDTGYSFISSGLGFAHEVIFGTPQPHVHGHAFADLAVDETQLIERVKQKL